MVDNEARPTVAVVGRGAPRARVVAALTGADWLVALADSVVPVVVEPRRRWVSVTDMEMPTESSLVVHPALSGPEEEPVGDLIGWVTRAGLEANHRVARGADGAALPRPVTVRLGRSEPLPFDLLDLPPPAVSPETLATVDLLVVAVDGDGALTGGVLDDHVLAGDALAGDAARGDAARGDAARGDDVHHGTSLATPSDEIDPGGRSARRLATGLIAVVGPETLRAEAVRQARRRVGPGPEIVSLTLDWVGTPAGVAELGELRRRRSGLPELIAAIDRRVGASRGAAAGETAVSDVLGSRLSEDVGRSIPGDRAGAPPERTAGGSDPLSTALASPSTASRAANAAALDGRAGRVPGGAPNGDELTDLTGRLNVALSGARRTVRRDLDAVLRELRRDLDGRAGRGERIDSLESGVSAAGEGLAWRFAGRVVTESAAAIRQAVGPAVAVYIVGQPGVPTDGGELVALERRAEALLREAGRASHNVLHGGLAAARGSAVGLRIGHLAIGAGAVGAAGAALPVATAGAAIFVGLNVALRRRSASEAATRVWLRDRLDLLHRDLADGVDARLADVGAAAVAALRRHFRERRR